MPINQIKNKVNKSNANFVRRLKQTNRQVIPDWSSDSIATHKLSVGTDKNGVHFIYPEVQEVNNKLIDYTRPPYNYFAGQDNAIERKDTVQIGNTNKDLNNAIKFTEEYKQYYPKFKTGGKTKHKIEAEGGEVIQSNKPFTVKRGGIAIPLGDGFNLLKGRSHEQGGINIDMKGSGRIWSDVPLLNGKSPAERLLEGEDPNILFTEQEIIKNTLGLNDDGSKKRLGGEDDKNNIDWDNTTTGKLINYVENKDSIGYKNGRWYRPLTFRPDLKGKIDNNNFGLGVDANTNPHIQGKIKKDKKNREYITVEEEKEYRYKSINNARDSANKRFEYARKKLNSNNKISEIKRAITESAIYNLGQGYVANNLFEDMELMKALLNGTDKEYNEQVNKYYKKKERNDRINKTNDFFNFKLGGNTNKEGLIYHLTGNVKQGSRYLPFTGERKKALLGLTTGDWIKGGANLVGSLLSFRHNLSSAKNIPEVYKPVYKQAVKLNTNYNINPQLNTLSEMEAASYKDINSNTSSSNTALGRRQAVKLNSLLSRNELYNTKEQEENKLINTDRLNQQEVANANVDLYNAYLDKQYARELESNKLRDDAVNGLINNLAGTVGNLIETADARQERKNDLENKLDMLSLMYGDRAKNIFDKIRKRNGLKIE